MRRADQRIEAVEAAVYQVPTEGPEADGTLAWDHTTMVVVQAHGAGQTGIGWTYGSSACAEVVRADLAPTVCGWDAFDVPGAFGAMVAHVRNLGRVGAIGYAISAVETALWDLKARLLDLPLYRLLGAVREEAPVYGSGGFTTYDDTMLREQLSGWVLEQHIPRVKIKIGESWGRREQRDLSRIRLAREAIGPDAELYVDANGAYTAKQAIRVGEAMRDDGVRWFEEPVSSDDLDGLRQVRGAVPADVAAGEYGYDLFYFRRMVESGAVDCLQIDLTRCGGILEWLRAAALAAAHGLQVSAHTAPQLHLHVAVATPNLRHLEWFHDHVRIESMFFDGARNPIQGALRPDPSRPGLGLDLRTPDANRYRVA